MRPSRSLGTPAVMAVCCNAPGLPWPSLPLASRAGRPTIRYLSLLSVRASVIYPQPKCVPTWAHGRRLSAPAFIDGLNSGASAVRVRDRKAHRLFNVPSGGIVGFRLLFGAQGISMSSSAPRASAMRVQWDPRMFDWHPRDGAFWGIIRSVTDTVPGLTSLLLRLEPWKPKEC